MKAKRIMTAFILTSAMIIASTAVLGLSKTRAKADTIVEIDAALNTAYDLDFSNDKSSSDLTVYKINFTCTKTWDYVLASSGSHQMSVEARKVGSTTLNPISKTKIDDYNDSYTFRLEEGNSYSFRICRYSSTSAGYAFSGPNDVKVTLKEYVDNSKVLAYFNSTDFPDDIFRADMEEKADYFKDGKLTQFEADKIYYLSVRTKVADLKGLEHFRKLEHLWVSGSKIQSLDVKNFSLLNELFCGSTDIGSLDLSGNPELTKLSCNGSNLTKLDLSKNPKLTELDCGRTDISTLDLSNLPKLVTLSCYSSKLNKLDVSKCPLLKTLKVNQTLTLTDLNVSGCSQLEELIAYSCNLSSLDLSKTGSLRELDLSNNNIQNLDLTTNPHLESVECDSNSLKTLKASGLNELLILRCQKNNLVSLSLDGDWNLEKLSCESNNLDSLNLSASPNISYAFFNGTKSNKHDGSGHNYVSYDWEDTTASPTITLTLSLDETVNITAHDVMTPDPGIPVDETNFPDPVFREYVEVFFDRSKDGYLSDYEIFNAKKITMKGEDVADLTGVKLLTSLTSISITSCKKIKTLDISGLKELQELQLNKSFENINVKGCTNLHTINANNNTGLKSINLSDCTDLTNLNLSNTKISTLDISKCSKLGTLDVSNMSALKSLDISDNPIIIRSYLEGELNYKANSDKKILVYTLERVYYYLCVDKDLEIIYKKPGPTPAVSVTPTAGATPKVTEKPAADLKLNKTKATVVSGKTTTLSVANANNISISWKSSDSKIATVDSKGKVTAKMAGIATITAKASGKSMTCKVTVLYKDVTNPDDFWYAPTNYLTAKNVVKGYANQTEFRPANNCTRAQMVTFLYRLQGEPATKSNKCKFDDVQEKDYFFKPVIWATEKGITTGVSAKKFAPQKVCTRAQTVTFLWRMAGKPEPGKNAKEFPDVDKKAYYHKATLWASDLKILAGLPDGRFNPEGKCLRRQMVTFLYKYDKYVNGKG